MLKEVSVNANLLYENILTLEKLLLKAQSIKSSPLDQATSYRKTVFSQMVNVRTASDTLETLIPCDMWPIPTYLDLLFRL